MSLEPRDVDDLENLRAMGFNSAEAMDIIRARRVKGEARLNEVQARLDAESKPETEKAIGVAIGPVDEEARSVPCLCCHEDGVAFYTGVWVCLACTFSYCAECKRCLACCQCSRVTRMVKTPR